MNSKVPVYILLCSCSFVVAQYFVDSLSIDEKIGQLFMVAAYPHNRSSQTKPLDNLKYLIEKHKVGGIIFLGTRTWQEQYELIRQLKVHNGTMNKIPLLYGIDAEWGAAMRISDSPKFPYNLSLGAIRDTSLIKTYGYHVGQLLKKLGIDINFAPVADCNTNPLNPVINKRSFGDNPYNVAGHVRAYVEGLQEAGIAACAKHFPGHGDTSTDTHTGLAIINKDLKDLMACEFIPFDGAIKSGVKAIMTAHILIPSLDQHNPATLSQEILTNILRKQLLFDGLIITDALNMKAITQSFSSDESVWRALKAGSDILLVPTDVPLSINRIKQELATGALTIKELDQHVQRILDLKNWILKNHEEVDSPVLTYDKELKKFIKQLYAKTVTLNQKTVSLPHPGTSHIAVISIGESNCTYFVKKLAQKYIIDEYHLGLNATLENCLSVVQSAQKADHIIATIFDLTYKAYPYGIGQNILDAIKKLSMCNVPTNIILFCNPYALNLFDAMSGVCCAYEDHPYAQKAAAQVIMGVISTEGTLPLNLSPL